MPPARRLVLVALVAAACRAREGDLASPSPEQRAAAISRLAASREEASLPALLVAADDPSPLVRKAAAGAFAARGGAAATEALGKLASDPEPEVASAAARGLSALPSERRARELLTAAYPRGGPAARAEIAQALVAVGGSLREAVELEARLAWERNVLALRLGTPVERAGAAEELGRSGRREAVQLLGPLLEREAREDGRVVAAAARALGAVRELSVRPALEELLEESGDADRAEAAADGLGALGDPEAAPSLAAAAAGGSERVAAAAIEALAALPQAPEVGLALCQVALKAVQPRVAARAAAQLRQRESECPERPLLSRLSRSGADALAGLAAVAELRLSTDGGQAAGARALQLLGSQEATVRTAAARALGALAPPGASETLTKRAQELGERLARARAADPTAGEDLAEELGAVLPALAQLRAARAAELAAARLADPAPALRSGVVKALGLLGGEHLDRLAPALADPDPRVWTEAADALGRIGPGAAPALVGAARQAAAAGDVERCVALARALGESGAPGAVPGLAALIAGPAPGAAAVALGRIGTKDAMSALLALLAGPEPRGRAEALEALGALAAQEAGPAAVAELTSDRAGVRAAAARALARVRYEPASATLEALRGDYDGQVRRAAVDALAKLPVRAAR